MEPKRPKGASIMQPETLVYPVQVRGDLDPALSRWQWLVKWILAIPHYIALLFLHIAYFVVTVIAFFAILVTGKYPRALFDFDVCVLRCGCVLAPLIGILLLMAVVALRFTARYPKGLYDLVIGINRWAIRVRAYSSLMRDEYPPFRLDMGPREPEPPAAPETA